MDSESAHVAAQNRSEKAEHNYRQHVVMLREGHTRTFEAVSDVKLQKLSSAVWCGGYYKGAFTG